MFAQTFVEMIIRIWWSEQIDEFFQFGLFDKSLQFEGMWIFEDFPISLDPVDTTNQGLVFIYGEGTTLRPSKTTRKIETFDTVTHKCSRLSTLSTRFTYNLKIWYEWSWPT